ncbi:MAG: hypothetical protein AAGA48_03625 [Myxococcota bacterium]
MLRRFSLAFTLCAVMACEAELPATAPPPDADPAYLAVGGVFSPDGLTGYAAVIDEVAPNTQVDLDAALALASGATIAVPEGAEGVFYIGLADSPVIQRYELGDDNVPVVAGELSLAGLGLQAANGGRNPIQLFSETEAYLVDGSSLQVIGFDPTAMILQGDPISIGDLAEPELGLGVNFIHRDGTRLILSTRYFRDDGSAEILGKVAIIDTATGDVIVDSETQCANLATSVEDASGNLYFASHSSQAARYSGGFAGEPAGEPCMVRMLQGADGFDDDFYVSLETLTGRPAGFAIQGSGDTAYLLTFDEAANPVTKDNVDRFTSRGVWEYYQVELGDAPVATAVPGVGTTAAYGLAFRTEVGADRVATPYVAAVAADLASSTFYDVSDPQDFVEAMTVPGFGFGVFRVR